MSEVVEGKPQLPPGVCFICEMSPNVRYIDTFRDFEGVVKERIDGRKYLCEECIEDGAKKFGFVTPEEFDAFYANLKNVEAELARVKKELEAFKTIKASLQAIKV